MVSEGFLVREIGQPSLASSFPSFEEDTVIWLVEPHHTKSICKFSGTLVHPNHPNKLGQTLSAFSHFVYQFSGEELALVDIQGWFSCVAKQNTCTNFELDLNQGLQ